MMLEYVTVAYDPAKHEPWVTASWKRSVARTWALSWRELDRLVPVLLSRMTCQVLEAEGGLVVGFACWSAGEHVAYAYIRASFRRLGLASRLLRGYDGPPVYMFRPMGRGVREWLSHHGWERVGSLKRMAEEALHA